MDIFFCQESESLFKKFFCYKTCFNCDKTKERSKEEEKFEVSKYHSLFKQLADHKNKLNYTKSLLNDKEITSWRQHTNFMNPSNGIIPYLKRNFKPELTTKAWCKFHELLCCYNVLGNTINENSLNCIHLCEAPGGFISSLNHYLKTREQYKQVKYNWVATTLNPYYEGNPLDFCVSDDRLVSYTLDKWCFGDDNTGSIFHEGLIKSIKKKFSEIYPIRNKHIMLITADGGFNCVRDPANQERDVTQLLYGELYTTMLLLGTNGTLVLKVFTMFEKESVYLMQLLNKVFQSVIVAKPASSKGGNSEVYIVAKGYRGQDYASFIIEELESHFPFDKLKNLTLDNKICFDFLKAHVMCTKKFKDLQINVINKNINFYNKTKRIEKKIYQQRKQTVQTFVDLCEMKVNKKLLVKGGFLRNKPFSNIQQRPQLVGSFKSRKKNEVFGFKDFGSSYKSEADDCNLDFKNVEIKLNFRFQLVYGKPLSSIHSSIYCNTILLNKYNEILASSKDIFTEVYDDPSSTCISGLEILYDIFTSETDLFYKELLPTMKRKNFANCYQKILDKFLKPQAKSDEIKKFDVLVCNLLKENPDSLHSDEIFSTKNMFDVLIEITKFLKADGKFIMLFSTSLTRLTSQYLALFTKIFSFSRLLNVQNHNNPSCSFFIGSNLILKQKLTQVLFDLVSKNNQLNEDFTLLQLFPVTQLLPLRCEFAKNIKMINEKCIQQRIDLILKKNKKK